VQEHRNVNPADAAFWQLGVATAEKTFSVDIIGEIESSINWISDESVGTIKPNQPSILYVEAESLLLGGTVVYELVSGNLPPDLTLLGNGDIIGKVKQFADNSGPGITRFFNTDEQSTMFFDLIFDDGLTSFDKRFVFSVKARDTANFAENIKQFYIDVDNNNTKTFANIYIKAFQNKQKRLDWFNFITDLNIFRTEEIYRPGDPNFGIQTNLRVLVFAGIESLTAVNYVQAMSRNHYRKQLRFGNVKSAVAKNFQTQEDIYEVIYVEVIDEYEKDGKSVSKTIELKDNIESKILISYDSIKIDSDIPLVSDSDHQRIFPNSFKNMRSRIKALGNRDREFLPLWMRSIQPGEPTEFGYTKALILGYVKPGFAESTKSRIKFSEFDFKSIDFTADRFIIDIIDGQIEDKYLAFPQRGEKLP
jgi:hypothetical protein